MKARGKEVKGKKTKDKPCNIYIFTEGNTERIYLQHYENAKKGIKIIPVDTEHTDAVGIVKVAKEFIDKNDVDIELGDRCYCVFDSDPESNPNINQAFNLIRDYKHKGLECIFSNPSFEIWFVLHYRKAPYGKSANEVKKIVRELVKSQVQDYKETTDIFDILLDKREKAIKEAVLLHNSQAAVQKDVLSHECNPYTNIFEFIQYLKDVKKDCCGVVEN